LIYKNPSQRGNPKDTRHGILNRLRLLYVKNKGDLNIVDNNGRLEHLKAIVDVNEDTRYFITNIRQILEGDTPLTLNQWLFVFKLIFNTSSLE